MTDTFTQDWNSLKDLIQTGGIESPKSAMWSKMVADFPVAVPEADLFAVNALRGYSFVRVEDETAAIRAEKALLWLTCSVSVFLKRLSGALWNYNLNRTTASHLMGFPRFMLTIDRLGLGQAYRELCARLGMAPDNFNIAKLFYISSVIRSIPALPRKARVLEIGGGTGNLAVILGKTHEIGLHVIVDLPEMLLYSSRTIKHFFPDAPVAFAHRAGDGTIALPDSGFLFVPHVHAARLPSDAFDLCLNIDSFQEMAQEQVQGYLALFQRACRAAGHIVTLNRRKMVGKWDNNPLLYPYGPNEILRWETDAFMVNALRTERVDSWLLRIEKKR